MNSELYLQFVERSIEWDSGTSMSVRSSLLRLIPSLIRRFIPFFKWNKTSTVSFKNELQKIRRDYSFILQDPYASFRSTRNGVWIFHFLCAPSGIFAHKFAER